MWKTEKGDFDSRSKDLLIIFSSLFLVCGYMRKRDGKNGRKRKTKDWKNR